MKVYLSRVNTADGESGDLRPLRQAARRARQVPAAHAESSPPRARQRLYAAHAKCAAYVRRAARRARQVPAAHAESVVPAKGAPTTPAAAKAAADVAVKSCTPGCNGNQMRRPRQAAHRLLARALQARRLCRAEPPRLARQATPRLPASTPSAAAIRGYNFQLAQSKYDAES